MSCHVVIPAAGNGSRMGASTPKQYLLLNDKPLIFHAIELFSQADKISSVHVVLSNDDTHWQQFAHDVNAHHPKVNLHYCGGETRAQTVLNGLHAMASDVALNIASDDWILVHDAARPGLTLTLLNHLIDTLALDPVGGLLALPLADTLKRADAAQCVAETLPRKDLWQAQTPQMFRYGTLLQALNTFNGAPTDEAEAIEALGLKPKLVTGALRNLKVTYPQDLAVLTALMASDF